jgi:MOSC domain-containing protein YiiM
VLRDAGFEIAPGAMGEKVTTFGIDLLALPAGTLLLPGIGGGVVEIRGLRNSCEQLEEI